MNIYIYIIIRSFIYFHTAFRRIYLRRISITHANGTFWDSFSNYSQTNIRKIPLTCIYKYGSCNRTKKTHKQVHAPCRNRDDDGVEGGGSSGGSGGDYERVSAAVQFLFSPGRPSPLSWQLSPPLLPWLN